MTTAVTPIPDPTGESEALQALLALCERRTGSIPPDLLVRHVLSVTAKGGWPVQRAALEAVLRRLAAAKQDGLAVAVAPPGGLGSFTTRREGSQERPYTTVVEQVEPLRASCDCRDFVRNSLGVCKHVLTALSESSRGKPINGRGRPRVRRTLRLVWDPVRPLAGAGDWLERVRLVVPGGIARGGAERAALGAHFRREGDGAFVLKATHASDPERRLELCAALLAATARLRRLAVDPSLVALLQQERRRWTSVIRHRPDSASIGRVLRTLERPLYPYQQAGFTASWPRAASCSPTTWGSARRPRPSRRATPCFTGRRSSEACSSCPPASRPSGCGSGGSSATRRSASSRATRRRARRATARREEASSSSTTSRCSATST